jgi:hypothetical protein
VLSLPYGSLVGGEYRNNVLICAAGSRGRLVELDTTSGGAMVRVEIWRNKGRMAVSRAQVRRLSQAVYV